MHVLFVKQAPDQITLIFVTTQFHNVFTNLLQNLGNPTNPTLNTFIQIISGFYVTLQTVFHMDLKVQHETLVGEEQSQKAFMFKSRI